MPLLGTRPTSQTAPSEGGAVMSTLIGREARGGFEFPAPGRISHNFDHSRKVPQPVFVQANASVRERQTFGLWRLLKCPVEAICKRNQIWPFSGARVGENLTSYSCVLHRTRRFSAEATFIVQLHFTTSKCHPNFVELST